MQPRICQSDAFSPFGLWSLSIQPCRGEQQLFLEISAPRHPEEQQASEETMRSQHPEQACPVAWSRPGLPHLLPTLFLRLILFFFFHFIFFFAFIFISWRLITLQYCSGFCHTLTWISHGFTCVPHPDLTSHLPPHPIPLGLPSAPVLSTCLMHPTWAGDLFHPWYYTCLFQCFSRLILFYFFLG